MRKKRGIARKSGPKKCKMYYIELSCWSLVSSYRGDMAD